MAGIPMYHGIPTFGSVEAKMAEDRMKVLKTEEAEIDLEDYKKSKELMKKNALKEDAIKRLAESKVNEPTLIPTMDRQQDPMLSYQTQDKGTRQGPTGLDQTPTEYATDSKIKINPTSPFGTYDEAGAESPADMPYGFGGAIPKNYKSPEQVLQTQVEAGSGQEQPPTEGQPQEQAPIQGYDQAQLPQEAPVPQAPNNIATRAKKATLDFTEANDQVESAYNLAEMFKREGLLKPYYEQLKVAGNLEEKRTMAQSRRIAATKDVMEITGRVAGSYAEVAKRTNDPVELERAWQSTLMLLEMNGIPSSRLRTITDPRARLAIAEKYADASMSAAKKLELMQKDAKLTFDIGKSKKQLEIKERLTKETENMGAWKRETGNRKMEQKELTTYIKESKDTVASLQTTLNKKQATLEKLTSSNTYFDSETGLLLDPDTQARAIILAKQEVENIEAQINLERQKIATWTAKLKPGAKDVTTTTTNEVPKESKLPQEMWDKAEAEGFTRENQKELIEFLLEDQTKDNLEYIKKVFKTKHPGLNFDDYFAINTAKFK